MKFNPKVCEYMKFAPISISQSFLRNDKSVSKCTWLPGSRIEFTLISVYFVYFQQQSHSMQIMALRSWFFSDNLTSFRPWKRNVTQSSVWKFNYFSLLLMTVAYTIARDLFMKRVIQIHSHFALDFYSHSKNLNAA